MATAYEYGRTPEQGQGFMGLLDFFTPLRRPVISPGDTRYEEIDGAMYPVETVPGEYGDAEFGFSYMPAVQAVSGLLSDPVGVAKAVPGAMAGQIEDYATASLGALEGGYEGMITPDGEPIEASPILPIEYLLGGGVAALRQPGVTLGAAGGRLTKADLDPMGYSKIKLDRPLSEVEFDMAPRSLLIPERKIVTPEYLQNSVILFGPGDRTGVGLLRGIEGQEFDIPVEALGGRDYQLATPYAWASGESVVSDLLNRAAKAREETGIDNVFLAHSTMSPRAVDFTEMMSSTVAEMLKEAPITKKAAKSFDDMIKNHTVMRKPKGSKEKVAVQPYKDFPGVKSPKFREWMASQPGTTRRFIIEAMDADAYRSKGFPYIGKARYALTEAAQRNLPTFASGTSFIPLDIDAGPIANPVIRHGSYSTAMAAKGPPVQFSGSIKNDEIYRDFFEALSGATNKHGEPQAMSQKQYTFRLDNPYQVIDQERVDALTGLLGVR